VAVVRVFVQELRSVDLRCSGGILTPWSRGLFEKLTGPQLVTKFSAFYGTRRFITAFTRPAANPYSEPDR
jgi:hypothetical protein